MLRSLYAYKGSHARTLAFTSNENFLEIGLSHDANWVHVISERGCLGFVPKNYVAIDQVPPNEMMDMIDACIEAIHLTCNDRGESIGANEHEALQVLLEMRQEWNAKVPPTSHPNKRQAPPPPNRMFTQLSAECGINSTRLPSPSQPPPQFSYDLAESKSASKYSSNEETTSFVSEGNSVDFDRSSSTNKSVASLIDQSEKQIPSLLKHDVINETNISSLMSCIPKGYCKDIVEDVRHQTNISYSVSHEIVGIVFESLSRTFPPLSTLLQEIINENRISDSKGMSHSCSWEESGDGRRLVELLEKLRQCKEDDQQRTWALHEDEQMLTSLLNDIIDVLTNGDMEICKKVMTLDDFQPLLTVVQYYQMETRWNLRKLLLQIFAAVCQLASANISFLSSSVLPLEFTRVILHSKTSEVELQYTSLILGMVLSMADTLPFPHFSIMNETFIEEVLVGIESYNEYPETEGLAELYLTLILAFNLQNHTALRDSVAENIVISVLAKRISTKYFIEKLLLLFNREEDPVAMFEFKPKPPNSVMRMMVDIFSCPQTAKMLYVNDEKVVCDIILRQLTDLATDDQIRHDYLCLLEGVIVLGNWLEHKHHKIQFASRLNSIGRDESSPKDKRVVQKILEAIPELKM